MHVRVLNKVSVSKLCISPASKPTSYWSKSSMISLQLGKQKSADFSLIRKCNICGDLCLTIGYFFDYYRWQSKAEYVELALEETTM